MDELGVCELENEDDVTFTFQNLNYVKMKLFDPEIRYLQTKFHEKLTEV